MPLHIVHIVLYPIKSWEPKKEENFYSHSLKITSINKVYFLALKLLISLRKLQGKVLYLNSVMFMRYMLGTSNYYIKYIKSQWDDW